MFLRFSPFPQQSKPAAGGEAAVTALHRACSRKENSASRTTPSFLCRQQTLLNASSVLPDVRKQRFTITTRFIWGVWPWEALMRNAKVQRVFPDTGVSAQSDIYPITASSAPFQETDLRAAFPCCRQHARAQCRAQGSALGSRLPWPSPAAPGRPGTAAQTAPSAHGREKLRCENASDDTHNYTCE